MDSASACHCVAVLHYPLPRWIRSHPVAADIRRCGLPGAWREKLTLADGRELVLRPIEAADAEALRNGFELLSAEEVRMRFLHPMRELPSSMAERLAKPRRGKDFALVVAENLPPGEALVGAVVRASLDEDGRNAEFAIIVSRFLGRQGLGRFLMKRLLHWARLKRLDSLYGDVLDENVAMIELAQSLGFRREARHHEPGVTRIRIDLRPVSAGHAAH
jgi:RimJ/RimL family protein N-acetyltransferase